jgi:SAM-dependent methyltransferase
LRSHRGSDASEYLAAICEMLRRDPSPQILDLGCGNGDYTLRYARACGAIEVFGVDVHAESLRLASARGVQVLNHDLNHPLPFRNESFRAIVSTQVIEHLVECDRFASEVHRILKPDGYAIIATENLASWSNVFSLMLGFQPHVENVSKIRRIGNPFSGDYGQPLEHPSMHHANVFTYRCLIEFLHLHGFLIEERKCTAYPPFPSRLSHILSRLDPVHSRYIAFKIRRA